MNIYIYIFLSLKKEGENVPVGLWEIALISENSKNVIIIIIIIFYSAFQDLNINYTIIC